MNIKFNYNNFPKDKSVKYNIPIDISGVQLDQIPVVIEQESDGTVSQIETAEIKNDYVNFVYSFLPNGTDLTPYTYHPKDELGKPVVDIQTAPPQPVTEYRMVGESVEEVDIVNQLQEDQPKTMLLSNDALVGIKPAHKLISENTTLADNFLLSSTAPLCTKDILAAFGIITNNNYNIIAKKTSNIKGSVTKSQFKKILQRITDATAPDGIDVLVKEYGITDGYTIQNDPNYTGLIQKNKLSTVISGSQTFIDKHMRSGDMKFYTGAEVTPFMMSIKDAFKAYFIPADEMHETFVDALTNILDAISSNHILSHMVDIDPSTVGLNKKEIFSSTNENNRTAILKIYDSDGKYLHDDPTPIPVYEFVSADAFGVNYRKRMVDPPELDGNPTTKYYFVTANKPTSEENAQFLYQTRWDFDDTQLNKIISNLSYIKRQVRNAIIEATAVTFITGLGAALLVMIYDDVDTVNENLHTLNTVVRQIKWYQTYTNESVFPTKVFITDGSNTGRGRLSESSFTYNKKLARMLVPVYYGKIRKKERKRIMRGFSYTVIRKYDIGVRFVEIMFVNNNIFKQYRKRNLPNGLVIPTTLNFKSLISTNGAVTGTLASPMPNSVMSNIYINKTPVSFTIANASIGQFNGTFAGKILDAYNIQFNLNTSNSGNAKGAYMSQVIIPRPPSKGNDNKNITINYKMPHLPYDSEIKRFAYNQYGAFDQTNNSVQGIEIFHKTSKKIQNMRSGIDVYRKVEFLLKILETEFGKSRIHLIETSRSVKDQNSLQMGGDSSTFLSWHNYGLAVKIKITHIDELTPIKEGSKDYLKLIDIADAFITGAFRGDYGTPMNVVWCAQLVTGPDMFVWEFLPIGVHHKDAIKFRDSALQQEDPVIHNSYVNATNMIVKSIPANAHTKYVLNTSKAVADSIKINNTSWIDPKQIVNYSLPKGLILKDIHEFLTLVDTKIKANGSVLYRRKKIREWKLNNPVSFNQLVMYYALTGNYSAVRGLISGDYIDTFNSAVRTVAPVNPIAFLKEYLGSFYNQVQIKVDGFADSAYINLSNGLLTSVSLQSRSTQPESTNNAFGEQQVDRSSVEYGQYVNGKWIPEGSSGIISFTSTNPVIYGYNADGTITSDAYELHIIVATDIINEFKAVIKNFETLNIQFMYDSFFNSPNYVDFDTLENEFGVISTQDIIPLGSLRDLYSINKINIKTDPDGTLRGVGATAETVYEKLVSTAQVNGARLSVLSKEKPVIEALETKVDVEKLYKQLGSDTKNTMPSIKDLL